MKKTIFIPLWKVCDIGGLRRIVRELWPAWSQIVISDCGKYLGFMIGPGGSESMWSKSLGKVQKRIAEWAQIHPGMMYTILAHNHFIAPIISYIAQLVPPSNEVVHFFDTVVYKLFPGPGNWITTALARSLRNIGFSAELVDPTLTSQASMLRYYSQTNCDIDGMSVEMYLHLERYRKSDQREDSFLSWHCEAFTLNLASNKVFMGDHGINEVISGTGRGGQEARFAKTLRTKAPCTEVPQSTHSQHFAKTAAPLEAWPHS